MDRQYEEFYKWVKRELGLELKSYKQSQLQRRINTVKDKSGIKSLKDYAKLLEEDKEARDIFLDYITINVTEFYRNREIFEDFEEIFKREVLSRNRRVRIWSAACSIGAEPYTLAIILDKNNILEKSKILATDIDENVLSKAKKGIYLERDIKNLKSDERDKYFDIDGRNYLVKDDLKRSIDFKRHDLILDRYEKGLDAIVCRNVTIYFKDETKDEIYRKMSDSLVDGGLLFTGATESIYTPEDYGLKKLQTFIYQKQV